MTNTATIQLTTQSVAETVAVGRAIASVVAAGDVIALHGELGAGKTQLIRGLAGGLGVDERVVCSPTFVVMQEYATSPNAPPLLHIDAYRIDALADLDSTGWTAELADQCISAIEWAERIAGELPADRLEICLRHAGQERREIALFAFGGWAEREAALRRRVEPLMHFATESGAACPICRSRVAPHTPTFPFCSSRCKTIDLGRWMDGRYRISREVNWEADDLTGIEFESEEQQP